MSKLVIAEQDNFCISTVVAVGRDSSVGIANRYVMDWQEIESRCWARFSAPVQTGPGAHQGSYTRTTGTESFPVVGEVVNGERFNP
jgi:roadblock/LC7 domain-containing protein